MTNVLAVQQAKTCFDALVHADKRTAIYRLTPDQKQMQVDMVIALAEFSLFSNAHIAEFTGMRPSDVTAFTRKTDTTGGRLPGASLGPVLEVMYMRNRHETDVQAVATALAAGVSKGMLSKLSGIPMTTLIRYAKKAAA